MRRRRPTGGCAPEPVIHGFTHFVLELTLARGEHGAAAGRALVRAAPAA